MTKQLSGENPLKYHLPAEANKVNASVNSLMENPPLAICNTHTGSERESQFNAFQLETVAKPETEKLGKFMMELFNLENWVESESPVKIKLNLDLYQMER